MQSYCAQAQPWTPDLVPVDPKPYYVKHDPFASFANIVRNPARWQRIVDESELFIDVLNALKAMAGRAGAEITQRGQDKHLHYSRGVTVEEMCQALLALMQLVPSGPVAGPKSRDGGREGSGRDRESDDELAVTTGPCRQAA
jgi:hypothetical protein